MSGKSGRVHLFWGAALGIAASELALAQLAAAATPEARAGLVLRMAEQGEIRGVGVGGDGRGGLLTTAQDFDKENWADVVAWDKADEPVEPWDKEAEMPEGPTADERFDSLPFIQTIPNQTDPSQFILDQNSRPAISDLLRQTTPGSTDRDVVDPTISER